MTSAVSNRQPGRLATWARFGLIVVAWTFALGAVTQVFLAGLSVFDSATYWVDHVNLGRMMAIPALLLPVLALAGRIGIRLGVLALGVTILYVLQMMLANLDAGTVAALHAVNALALIWLSAQIGTRTLGLVRARV